MTLVNSSDSITISSVQPQNKNTVEESRFEGVFGIQPALDLSGRIFGFVSSLLVGATQNLLSKINPYPDLNTLPLEQKIQRLGICDESVQLLVESCQGVITCETSELESPPKRDEFVKGLDRYNQLLLTKEKNKLYSTYHVMGPEDFMNLANEDLSPGNLGREYCLRLLASGVPPECLFEKFNVCLPVINSVELPKLLKLEAYLAILKAYEPKSGDDESSAIKLLIGIVEPLAEFESLNQEFISKLEHLRDTLKKLKQDSKKQYILESYKLISPNEIVALCGLKGFAESKLIDFAKPKEEKVNNGTISPASVQYFPSTCGKDVHSNNTNPEKSVRRVRFALGGEGK